MWNSFLQLLNLYGGLIGLISLVLTMLISFTTGNIKRNITQVKQLKQYKSGKQASISHLKEIAASIKMDQIYDNDIKTELLMETNKLLKYEVFLDAHCKYYIFRINWILRKNSINQKNAHQIVSYVAKICGRMSVNPVRKDIG